MGTLFQFDLAGRTYGLAIANRHSYVLEGGRVLPIRVWPAWCERCRKFTAAEQILPIADEAKELGEVEYFAERPGLIPPDRRVPVWQLPELRLRKTWRATRRSPAKCLGCGSVDITSIWPGPEVDVPGRGKCVVRFRGLAALSGPPGEYYSAEGDRVPLSPARRRPG
jgi:hypothetical protein